MRSARFNHARRYFQALQLAASIASVATPGLAQDSTKSDDAPSSSEPQDERLMEAKELFRQGVAVFEARDTERALEYFRRSRALYPSGKNSVNAAICLDRLGRYDEALELYEEVVAKHLADVEGEKASITQALGSLRTKVGSLMVSSNVEGSLVIDGRPRGRLPLTTPLRLLPGSHLVRVIKDGYMTQDLSVEIAAGATASLDAPLTALVASGGLRVEAVGMPGAEVVIDGAVVGASPWEGTLSPGTHVVQARTAQKGSRLLRTIVVVGQTTLTRMEMNSLGPYVHVDAIPPSATLFIDGVEVGKGKWEGVLPAGQHAVEASEEGYWRKRQSVDLDTKVGPSKRVELALEADRKHPRWPQPPTGHFWVGASAGWVIAPRIHSGAEKACTEDCNWAMGGLVEARVGYEFTNRISAEIMTGYLSMASHSTRRIDSTFSSNQGTQPITWTLDDALRLTGPLIGAGTSMTFPVVGDLWLRARGTAGLMLARVSDAVEARVSTGSEPSRVDIEGAGHTAQTTALFVMPEVQVEKSLGNWRIGASLAALWIPQKGPNLSFGTAAVPPNCSPSEPTAAGCAGNGQVLSSERAYGSFVAVMPRIGAQLLF